MSNYRLSARGIVLKDGCVLLNEFNHGEYYNIPGGGVEVDEALRDAVEREVLEESGFTVVSKELLFIYEYNPKRDSYKFGVRGQISHVFLCEVDDNIPVQEISIPDVDPNKPEAINTGV